MKEPLILALDIGTSSVRAALYDGKAEPIAQMSAKIERSLTATADGGSEIDADEAFAQVVTAIEAVLDRSKKLKGEIEYVVSCSLMHTLVGIDDKGKPTTKVFGWADTRSRKFTDVLRKRFDESEMHDRTGTRFHSSYWTAKLLWQRNAFPDVFAKTVRWLALSDYVAFKLSGGPVTSLSIASGSGFLDVRKCGWDAELLKFLKLKPVNLPTIAESYATTYKLNKTFAKRWPRLANAQWFPSIADGIADNIGAGCVTPSKAALMVGTSGAMRVAYPGEPPAKIPDGLWCYRIDRKRVILGGALSDGGGLYRWLKDNLKLPKDAEAEISRRGAAAHGLSFLPFLAGERGTGYHESATGAVLGLQSSNDAIDILQAAMESVAYRFAELSDQLNSVVKVKEIVASGGALRESPVWTQIIADVLGRDLTMSGASESSSRGAVLLALESIGKIENIETSPMPNANRTAYHPKCHAIYKSAREQHREDYKLILDKKS
ncbi:MAG TPA: gluconokinase [Pyrinomonadaceae bacterium]|nr:gluconokinase [Pyrinomonadaceae bacterium]